MSSISTFVECSNLQGQLSDIFCTGRAEDTPIINFLFSAFNNGGLLQQRAIPSIGKKRTVELTYSPRVLESEVKATVNRDCVAENVRGFTSELYDLDTSTGVEIEKTFDIVDLITICESNDMYMANLIQSMLDGAKRKMETQAAVYLAAGTGAFSTKDLDQDGTAIVGNEKIVSTKYSAALGGAPNNRAHSAIMQTARLNSYCSAPIIAGEYEIAQYYDDIKIGCCSDKGINFDAINPSVPLILRSYRITDALASTLKFLTFSTGAALPVQFNLYGGSMVNMANDDTNYAGIITDPATGIDFDLRITKFQVGTCTKVSVIIGTAWDLFFPPAGLYAVGDHLRGVNFVNKYLITNPA